MQFPRNEDPLSERKGTFVEERLQGIPNQCKWSLGLNLWWQYLSCISDVYAGYGPGTNGCVWNYCFLWLI